MLFSSFEMKCKKSLQAFKLSFRFQFDFIHVKAYLLNVERRTQVSENVLPNAIDFTLSVNQNPISVLICFYKILDFGASVYQKRMRILSPPFTVFSLFLRFRQEEKEPFGGNTWGITENPTSSHLIRLKFSTMKQWNKASYKS